MLNTYLHGSGLCDLNLAEANVVEPQGGDLISSLPVLLESVIQRLPPVFPFVVFGLPFGV